jgi:hypothetical protein
LGGDHAAQHKDAQKRQQNDADDRQSAWNVPALERPNERREHEAEKDRERDRDKNLAAEIKRSDDDCSYNGCRHAARGVKRLFRISNSSTEIGIGHWRALLSFAAITLI